MRLQHDCQTAYKLCTVDENCATSGQAQPSRCSINQHEMTCSHQSAASINMKQHAVHMCQKEKG